MTKESKDAVDRVGAGWAELREGRWVAARSTFEEALDDEETPESLEGLSWAAWWLDDAKAVFEARERGYRMYRERGNPADAARMATWLAADQLDFRGAVAVARGWLQRAHRLSDPLEPEPDHGWLAFHDGYLAHGSGDNARARDRAAIAAELGRRFGVADLEMLGLALEGAALVASAHVEEGMRYSTRRPRRRSRGKRRSRSPARGPAASWSRRALRSSTTSARPSGATASLSSRNGTGAATCLPSAGPSTGPCTSGGAGGTTRRRC